MRRIHDAKLAAKLRLISFTALVLLFALGIGGMFSSSAMNSGAEKLITGKLRPAQAIGDIRASVLVLGRTYSTMQQEGNRTSLSSRRADIQMNATTIAERLKVLETAGFVGSEKDALDQLESGWSDYQKASKDFWATVDKDGIDEVFSRQYGDIDTDVARMDGTLRRMSNSAQQGVTEAETSLNRTNELNLALGGGAMVIGLIVLLWASAAVRKSLLKPVLELTALAEEMGAGDLRTTLKPIDRKDEIGRLHNAMVRMSGQIRGLLESVTQSGRTVSEAARTTLENLDQVNDAATQLADAISRVAAGAGGQNTAVQEAVSVMDQLRGAIDQVARGAQEQATHVNETTRTTAEAGRSVQDMAERVASLAAGAESARTVAESGIAVVEKAVVSMQRLQERVERTAEAAVALERESKQIRNAVTLITEMADQTNLLALNAAIEAARAGESGRGFAVVADAIRTLAERSGRSAEEITGLIHSVESRTVSVAAAMQEGSEEARQSNALAGDAGQALRRIVQTVRSTVQDIEGLRHASGTVTTAAEASVRAVDQIAAVVEENTATTEEMAASSEQVQQAIRSIAEVAQETAATSEQVSASVEELSATTEHVAQVAQELVNVSEQLRHQVERFRL